LASLKYNPANSSLKGGGRFHHTVLKYCIIIYSITNKITIVIQHAWQDANIAAPIYSIGPMQILQYNRVVLTTVIKISVSQIKDVIYFIIKKDKRKLKKLERVTVSVRAA
jgi:hypothetical protein